MENVCSEIPNTLDISKENICNLQKMLNGMLAEYELSEKQLELTGEVASALAMHGRFEILDKLVNSTCQQKFEKFLTNESFVRALIALKFEQRKYREVIKFLKRGQFSSYAGLLEIWDEAHYGEKEEKLGHKLNPLIRFRVRQKNPPPRNICPSGERPSTKLSSTSKTVLNRWFMENLSNPYPSQETKQSLANLSGLTTYQVKTWFANARRRHKLSGKANSSEGQKETFQGFCKEHSGGIYSSLTRNVPTHHSCWSPYPATKYLNVAAPTTYVDNDMTNLQKSSISKVQNTGYLTKTEPHCSGSCLRELAQMCDKLQIPNNQSGQVTRISTSQSEPMTTSPWIRPWQGQDMFQPWGSSQTPMMNPLHPHITPVEMIYHADETPANPASNSLPQPIQVASGYLSQSVHTAPDGPCDRYFQRGVNYSLYQPNDAPVLIKPTWNMLTLDTGGVDQGASSQDDPYTPSFDPEAFQTFHPQSEREVAMVLLDLSSDRSTQSSQSSQTMMS